MNRAGKIEVTMDDAAIGDEVLLVVKNGETDEVIYGEFVERERVSAFIDNYLGGARNDNKMRTEIKIEIGPGIGMTGSLFLARLGKPLPSIWEFSAEEIAMAVGGRVAHD